MMQKLTARQKSHLKSLCHSLKPVVIVGQKGLQENVLNEIELALDHHELIKIKLGADRETHKQFISDIGARTGAELVQSIGQTASFYRRNSEAPVIRLP